MAMHFYPKEMTFHLFWDAAKFWVVFFIYWDQVWSLKKRKDWSHLSSLLASMYQDEHIFQSDLLIPAPSTINEEE